MSAYTAFVRSGFLTSLAYRSEVWANIFGKLVQVFARVAIWLAVYAGVTAVDGISIGDMITYALLGGVVMGATRYDRIIRHVGTALKTGDVAVWLLKPVHYPLYLLSIEAGASAYTFLLAVVPTIVIVALVYGMHPPASLFHGVMFAAYCGLSFIIHFLCAAIFGVLAFWLMTIFSLEWLLQSLISLLSGLLIPFWFFPEPFGSIASHQPLAWLVYYPSAVWLGRLDIGQTLLYFGFGIAWAGLLTLALTLLWRRAASRITVHGG
ncbi:ABC transporter permease [Devosia psychrophila]|uniref:ABC transporter permease n=1 Tax=Devosia psychrophila TaxID=728005 RepID=A0A0F5PZU5_9HYPH|nr:ABC-2 family transporter protein [Devosia psychrophila]KKC34120.1 ABC transporter permease [Devosia psychrophila]SFC96566.1 ABC-2 type transport system permease protein [Devosia psychrophila]